MAGASPSSPHRIAAALIAGAAALAASRSGLAAQSPNAGRLLLQQCEAMLSGTAESTARMTCENTIWSTLRVIEQIRQDNPSLRLRYCAPDNISLGQGATLYVRYVRTHPDALDMPAEHALLRALEAAYPCRS
jgi:hypothetical protein